MTCLLLKFLSLFFQLESIACFADFYLALYSGVMLNVIVLKGIIS